MTPDSYQRKLTSILSTDLAGYSRLMSKDEDAAIQIDLSTKDWSA